MGNAQACGLCGFSDTSTVDMARVNELPDTPSNQLQYMLNILPALPDGAQSLQQALEELKSDPAVFCDQLSSIILFAEDPEISEADEADEGATA